MMSSIAFGSPRVDWTRLSCAYSPNIRLPLGIGECVDEIYSDYRCFLCIGIYSFRALLVLTGGVIAHVFPPSTHSLSPGTQLRCPTQTIAYSYPQVEVEGGVMVCPERAIRLGLTTRTRGHVCVWVVSDIGRRYGKTCRHGIELAFCS